ncbi:Gfo/Idh/MocA family protein [Chloroflexota bacterium]
MIRVAIVGCGFITREVHLPALRRCKGVKITALCDKNIEIARSVAQRFAIKGIYDDFDKMLASEAPDVVDVCTSIDTHSHFAIKAMEAGCHVLSEKPMAANVQEADEEVEVARRTGKKLCVIHNMLFLPVVIKAKEIVSKGVLGEITGVDIRQSCPPADYPPIADPNHWWHRLPGGIFGDTLPHPIYLTREFLGGQIEPLFVHSSKLGKYEHLPVDEVQIVFKGRNGIGTVVSSCNWPSLWELHLYGSRKCLYADLNNSYLMTYTCKTNNGRGIASMYAKENISRSLQILGSSIHAGIKMMQGQHRGHFVQIQKFIESIKNDTRPPTTGDDDREIIKLLEQVIHKM